MRRRADPDERPGGDGGVCGDGQRAADVDGVRGVGDDGAGGAAAVGVEEIRGAVNLRIVVVCGAGTAEAAAAADNGRIGEKERC